MLPAASVERPSPGSVRGVTGRGTVRAWSAHVSLQSVPPLPSLPEAQPGPVEPMPAVAPPVVGVVEDEPELAALAAELCAAMGLQAVTYPSAAVFLRAVAERALDVVVLDWRLERELSAGIFLTVRHRFPHMPIVCWTAFAPAGLPDMILADPLTRLVDKAAGVEAFEAALRWALDARSADRTPRP
jgi:CheY-like chemotaxis protein